MPCRIKNLNPVKITDNAGDHKVEGVKELIESKGAELIQGLGINKISNHPEMLPGNEFPGCYVPSLRDFYMSCKDIP